MRLFKESSSKRIVMSPSSSVKRFEISSEVPVVMYFLRERERERARAIYFTYEEERPCDSVSRFVSFQT